MTTNAWFAPATKGLAMDAQKLLDARDVAVRVVSIPASTVFDRQDRNYREDVLGRGLVRVGVEAGVTRWWGQYGCSAALGVDSFGESARKFLDLTHFRNFRLENGEINWYEYELCFPI